MNNARAFIAGWFIGVLSGEVMTIVLIKIVIARGLW